MIRRSSELELPDVRGLRVAEALEAVVARRIAGEDFSDDAVARSFPDLMPDLGQQLHELRWVEEARRQAASSSDAETSTGAPPTLDDASSVDQLGRLLPGYEIQTALSRGGQGIVYKALQKSTRRTVAIKVMREGPFAGPRDRARFEREVRVLARLKHPNIVTIHDSGVAAGHFYFVMDFVDGRPLDQCVASRGFKIEQTLALFADVCEAVHAAHLLGVIHRDLKPSNVLVAGERIEGSSDQGIKGKAARDSSTSIPRSLDPLIPSPKILDFGLAKIAGDHWGDSGQVSMTDAGQFVGSLPWAAPEQAAGRVHEIDVRTDVYSLGVMLYHSLTGVFPYSLSDNLHTMLGRIIHSEPPRPSSQRRNIDDDVDTIVLKCLAKEPARRYQSAGELARDIRHYLAGEPIDAKRDNAWYVLRKALRRHRGAAAVAALFVVMILGSTIALSVLYQQAQAQTQIAQRASADAQTAAQVAEQRRIEAQRQTARATRVQSFLQRMLTAAKPEESRGQAVDVRDVLKQSADRIESDLHDEPEVEAAIRATIGAAYSSLGDYAVAEPHLRAALAARQRLAADDPIGLLESMRDLAIVLWKTDRSDQAEPMLRQALVLLEQSAPQERSLELTLLDGLGSVLQTRDRYAEAEPIFREAIDLGARTVAPDDEGLRSCRRSLALLLIELGRLAEAEPIQRDVLAQDERTFGDDHPTTLGSMNNMAGLLQSLGHWPEAADLYRRTAEISRRVRGENHPDTLTTLNNLAMSLRSQNKFEEAEAIFRQVLDARRDKLGPRHGDTLTTLVSLANVLMARGKADQAEPMMREAVDVATETMPPEHVYLAVYRSNLGRCLVELKRYDEAEPLLRESLSAFEKTLGANHAYTRKARAAMVELYEAWGRPQDAAPYRPASGPRSQQPMPPDSSRTTPGDRRQLNYLSRRSAIRRPAVLTCTPFQRPTRRPSRRRPKRHAIRFPSFPRQRIRRFGRVGL